MGDDVPLPQPGEDVPAVGGALADVDHQGELGQLRRLEGLLQGDEAPLLRDVAVQAHLDSHHQAGVAQGGLRRLLGGQHREVDALMVAGQAEAADVHPQLGEHHALVGGEDIPAEGLDILHAAGAGVGHHMDAPLVAESRGVHPEDPIAVEKVDVHVHEAGGDIQRDIIGAVRFLHESHLAAAFLQHAALEAPLLGVIGVDLGLETHDRYITSDRS